MSKLDCATIRRELDEIMLGEESGAAVSEHLAECNDCRDFNEKQMKLRQIVGSLGTVSAPADFDFRLRSRLARENGAASSYFSFGIWSLGQKSAAIGFALLLMIGAVVGVRQYLTPRTETNVAETRGKNDQVDGSKVNKVQPPTSPTAGTEQRQVAAVIGSQVEKGSPKRNKVSGNIIMRPLATKDSAKEQAPVIRVPGSIAQQAFSVDTSHQPLRFSVFDGQGNPRTISVPTVTFGSQRV